jgi:MFS family permease
VLGSLGALTIANFILSHNLDWRLAFWFGALIAVVGSIARTSLRETPEFVDAKLQLKRSFDKTNLNSNEILKQDLIVTQKVNKKTSLAYFIIQTARPIWFYFLYFYCAEILRNSFNYSAKQVIQHNLMLSYAEFAVMLVNTYLCYKFNPLKIIKYRTTIFNIFIIVMPFFLINITKVYHLLLIQLVVCMFQSTASPADAVFYTHFPVFKRFKYISFLYALSRALVNVITSLSIVYLTSIFNYWGLLIIFIPIMIGFHFAINYFIKLEEKNSKHNKLLNFNSAVFA